MLSKTLEKSLRLSLSHATSRKHEYATLEHLLLALLDDRDAVAVLEACDVSIQTLRDDLTDYIDNELTCLTSETVEDVKATADFQRVVQRAAIEVQSSGRTGDITGAHILVSLFSERESHAVSFLHEQNMSRLDAVNFIDNGITKKL